MKLHNKNQKDCWKNGARGTIFKKFIGDTLKRKKNPKKTPKKHINTVMRIPLYLAKGLMFACGNGC